MASAGWYDDPWGQAQFRWFDGTSWTGAIHPVGPAADSPSLLSALGGAERVAVIDVETTGLYANDRVVELAIVTMDAGGQITDEFETLLDPSRAVGATWIHGISASMLTNAPIFEDIADHVAARLDGAVIAGHNLAFDTRMLGNEFRHAGIDVYWGSGLDTLRATGCKLGVACAEYGVPLTGAHRALHDARATAALLTRVFDAIDRPAAPASVTPKVVHPLRVLTRDGFAEVHAPAPYLAELARGVHATLDVAPYTDLLDRALADLKLTAEERVALSALAHELGLDDGQVTRAHREFLNGLVDAALEDSVVTDAELDQLLRVAALLDLDATLVTRRTDPYRGTAGTLVLTEGLTVCFTGDAVDNHGVSMHRDDLEDLARRHRLVPVNSVTAKGCGLLVAADPATQSGKGRQARRFGIPVTSVAEFLRGIHSDGRIDVSEQRTPGTALVCVNCGDSWLAARRSTRPVCAPCKQGVVGTVGSASATALAAATPPALETLECIECAGEWERPRSRGRRPSRCPGCAA